MSPEICENKEYSTKTDIWSLGVILTEMCLLKPPFDAQSLPALALKISRGDYNSIPKHYSKEIKRLVSDLLQVDPNKRPNIHEVLKHPLIKAKIDQVLPKSIREREFSHTTLHTMNILSKPASKNLFA
jgi:NIMA (never in mitosis gene a)-related kinase